MSKYDWANKRKYCNRNCKNAHQKFLGIKPPSREGEIPWNRGKKLPQYAGKNSQSWKGGKPKCPECGKQLARRESKYCTPCWAKLFSSGKKSNLWKGGLSKLTKTKRQLDMQTGKYQTWRRIIFNRDDYICQICGERGGKLRANHIKKYVDYPMLRTNTNNGITICKRCDNLWVLHHEPEWENYFKFNLETRYL